ncbi:MAG TPA: DUF4912 domain-containing protein [Planctomycetota bacterium]|nr:DUF4912 domain-containing protein [Planctomycetota bacterium]
MSQNPGRLVENDVPDTPEPLTRETVGSRKSKRARIAAPITDPQLKIASTHLGSSKIKQVDAPAVAATPVENKPAAYVDRGLPLPENYGLDRLVALVRDPHWIFAYWELHGSKLPSVIAQRGQPFVDSCAWVLRVHRISEGVAEDIEVDPSAGCWYLHVGRSGRYQLELGLLSPEGEWISLLASYVVETPLDRPSDIIDDEWRMLPEHDAALLGPARELSDAAKRGGSGFLGASRLQSSFAMASSMAMLGSSASGQPVGSWMHSFQGASRVSGSGGSGGLGWIQNPSGALEPQLERPLALNAGPNWNAQRQLPALKNSKAAQPEFKVKLPRLLTGVPLPPPGWPPAGRVALKSR